ncbi:MAG: DUF4278 domain-containing protein [Prochlorococcus sp.]|nr:DUF4278 domain-containing protein [Prochlorococcaceae cyanobacterium ETNP2_MAG_10]MDP6195753.1 DUF4278 domain-containing protein [Prochlorococcaceae cyanobacterium ETNP18_MAG_17]MDP6851649.1 DUF4278 domain-containing protein [Prochlorococcaceae cyanobacterium ETNP1_MAG_8]HJL68664.1 DUF4278 domain-containing protein [Prochlorococcaceae cyanobacterium Gl_MAG_24]
MTTQERTYRGIAYKAADHEQLSSSNVEHIYRGHRYEAPLKHEAVPADTKVELNYRGKVYQHRKNDATNCCNN